MSTQEEPAEQTASEKISAVENELKACQRKLAQTEQKLAASEAIDSRLRRCLQTLVKGPPAAGSNTSHTIAIVGTVISIAAVLTAAAQVGVAYIGKDRELGQQKADSAAQLAQQAAQMEASREQAVRDWSFQEMKFVVDHRAEIVSDDPRQQAQMRAAMQIAFPEEIVVDLFDRIASSLEEQGTATPSTVQAWRGASEAIKSQAPGAPQAASTNPLAPPSGYRLLKDSELTSDLVAAAKKIRFEQWKAKPGTEFPLSVGGQDYVARLVLLYNPPGGEWKPFGYQIHVRLFVAADGAKAPPSSSVAR